MNESINQRNEWLGSLTEWAWGLLGRNHEAARGRWALAPGRRASHLGHGRPRQRAVPASTCCGSLRSRIQGANGDRKRGSPTLVISFCLRNFFFSFWSEDRRCSPAHRGREGRGTEVGRDVSSPSAHEALQEGRRQVCMQRWGGSGATPGPEGRESAPPRVLPALEQETGRQGALKAPTPRI